MRSAIESTMRENLRGQLQTMLDVEVAMLETWIKVQEANVSSLANNPQVRTHVDTLLTNADPTLESPTSLADPKRHLPLQKDIAPALSSGEYQGYFVADKTKRIISASASDLIGRKDILEYDSALTKALNGTVTISIPFPSVVPIKDDTGAMRTGVPTMLVMAPVRDNSFQVVAALALRIPPELEFTRILQLGRMGQTGETFAFDSHGRMLSRSRFEADMILLGLLADEPNTTSLLKVSMRDPGGDMTAGFRPKKRRADLPMTKNAASAVAGNSGIDVTGYRDYRGVDTIGAWAWLPEYGMGVATEMNAEEAFRPLTILQRIFWALYAILGLCAVALFIFTIIATKLRKEAQVAAIAAKKLGQYRLEEKLGSGGMGVVYKGFHSVLRRPTAIKMLSVDKVNEDSIERFEREVQITCQLNNAHTVAVYDFGRTDEGLFYYAMEFLDGIDLQSLIEKYGVLPEERVIRILRQICSSLNEAHTLGMVHRDIKPANIMLNRRGGEPDVVKVLDFGLVKALDEKRYAGQTAANGIMGTPLYMSPEAIQSPQSVDARSDLYAVGATGYFLLTGEVVFNASNVVELCSMHVDQAPMPPSQRLGKRISADLEAIILSCLEKSRGKRPQSARELAEKLEQCSSAAAWSHSAADEWWGRHERRQLGKSGSTSVNESAAAVQNRTLIGEMPEE